MGAALTYARRYALFTLVGIAGEDDLDAPDLGAAPKPAAELPRPGSQSNGQAAAGKRTAPGDGKLPEPSARSVLGVQLSASLRESLIEQLAAINSADEAAAWAHRNLPAKNTLAAADAKIVEERFRARLSAIGPSYGTCDRPAEGYEPPHAVPDQTGVSSASDAATRQKAPMRATKKQSRSDAIRALGKTVRLRDKDHRRFVLRQACLVCGRVPSDPHHLTFTQPRALGRRVSDEFIVPVCRIHHRELHRSGNEAAWWRKFNIDPIPIALRLWQQTRTDGGQSDPKLLKNARLDEGRTDTKPASQGAAGDGASRRRPSPSYSPKIAAWRDLWQDFARGAWRVDRVRRLMTRRLGLILLGWKFRRGVGCGDGAALAMALRRRAVRRVRGRQRGRDKRWARRHGCEPRLPPRARRS